MNFENKEYIISILIKILDNTFSRIGNEIHKEENNTFEAEVFGEYSNTGSGWKEYDPMEYCCMSLQNFINAEMEFYNVITPKKYLERKN